MRGFLVSGFSLLCHVVGEVICLERGRINQRNTIGQPSDTENPTEADDHKFIEEPISPILCLSLPEMNSLTGFLFPTQTKDLFYFYYPTYNILLLKTKKVLSF